MIETGIVALLNADATITSLVAGRIYPVKGPTNAEVLPFITYRAAASARSEYTFDVKEVRGKTIQFDVWTQQFSDSLSILSALRNVLSGFHGALNDGTYVLFAGRGNELANFDVELRSYRSAVDYEFEFVEA